jgi:hypothetical protein
MATYNFSKSSLFSRCSLFSWFHLFSHMIVLEAIVFEATREAKAVYSCTLQLPARVSPPSSVFSASSTLKSQSKFLRLQPRENAAHHSHHPEKWNCLKKKPTAVEDCGALSSRKEVRVLRPAYLPDFHQVISRFRSVVVSLPSVYSSHATYTRHFRSTFAATRSA